MDQADRLEDQTASSPGTMGPLRRREFRLYFIGNLASNSGTWLQNAALSVFLFNLTRSSFWVGLASTALFVPVLILALPSGVLADRTDRLRLLRNTQLVAGSLAIALTILIGIHAANKFVVIFITAGLGACVAVAIPTMQSLLPSLVPGNELSQAIALNSLTFNIARMLGPLAAAGAYLLGAAWAFGLNAVSFFILAVALTMIRQPPYPRPSEKPGRIRDALTYAWQHRRTRARLLAIAGLSLALDPITTLSPALVRSYGLPSSRAPFIFAAWGAGAVLGVTLGGGLIRRLASRELGWAGLAVMAAGLVGLGAARSFVVALGTGLISGWGYITATVSFTTGIHADVPEALRGRVSALWTLAFLGPRAFSGAIDGALADRVGPHLAAALFALPALAAIWIASRVSSVPVEPDERSLLEEPGPT
jgi:MFS family permease